MNCSSAFVIHIEYRPRRLFAEVHERNIHYARSTVPPHRRPSHLTNHPTPHPSPLELQRVLTPSSSRSCFVFFLFFSPLRVAPPSHPTPRIPHPLELRHRAVGQLVGYATSGVKGALSSLASQHVFSRKDSYKSSGSTHSSGSFPQLTVTCATAASPCHPSPRVYSKANDGE